MQILEESRSHIFVYCVVDKKKSFWYSFRYFQIFNEMFFRILKISSEGENFRLYKKLVEGVTAKSFLNFWAFSFNKG